MSHITSFLSENFKRLKVVKFKPSKGVQKVTGKNNNGKTSVLDSVQAALGGPKWAPEKVVREGQDNSKVVIETEELRVTRKWTAEGGTSLVVEEIGRKAPLKKPQEILNDLIGGLAFDPLEFTKLKPADQVEQLCAVTGLNVAELDAEYDRVYDERTAVNRELKALRGKLEGEAAPDEVPDPGAETDISAFVAEIERATKQKADNDAARKKLADLQDDLAAKSAEFDRLKEELKELIGREAKGRGIIDRLVDPDVTAIKAKVDQAKSENARIRNEREKKAVADRKADELAQIEQQAKDAERQAANHTSRLDEIVKEKNERLAAVKMPVPGLSIDRKTVLLNGVPLAQASSMQQIRVGLGIAAALNTKLRVVLIREGSLLDEDALADVEKWAEENDMQVWMEIVGSGRGGLELVDGEAKS